MSVDKCPNVNDEGGGPGICFLSAMMFANYSQNLSRCPGFRTFFKHEMVTLFLEQHKLRPTMLLRITPLNDLDKKKPKRACLNMSREVA